MASYAYSISLIIANIAIAVSAVGYGSEFFGVDLNATQTSQVTIVLLWFAAILNFRGNRFTGQLSNITIWGCIVPVLLIGTIGWFWFSPDTYLAAWNPNDLPFFEAIKESIALTLWGFLGFESAAANADAVENPKKNVPIATFAGTLAVAVIYILSRMLWPVSCLTQNYLIPMHHLVSHLHTCLMTQLQMLSWRS